MEVADPKCIKDKNVSHRSNLYLYVFYNVTLNSFA